MEKSIERGDPKKGHVDREPGPCMRDSSSHCAREPAHAESPEDRDRESPWHQRLANETADGGQDVHNAPKSDHADQEADEMNAELADRGIIGIERVLGRQDESDAGRHKARDKRNENRGRTGTLREKSGGAQRNDECGA